MVDLQDDKYERPEWHRCKDCNRPMHSEMFGLVEYTCGQKYQRQSGQWPGHCGLSKFPYIDVPNTEGEL